MIRPFTPDEVLAKKIEIIPSFVVEAVNTLLTRKFDGSSCRLLQNEVVSLAEEIGRGNGTLPDWANRQSFFSEHWLDFEKVFEKAGWSVIYDKPGYGENYEAFWQFSRK